MSQQHNEHHHHRHHRRHRHEETRDLPTKRQTSQEEEFQNDLDKLNELTKEDETQEQEPEKQSGSKHHRHHHKHRRKKKKKIKVNVKRILLIVLAVFLSLLVIAGAVFGVLYYTGHSSLYPDRNVAISIPRGNDTVVEDNGRDITHNGKTYRFNENVTSILFMGIDDERLDNAEEIAGTAGKADAVYLFTFDKVTQKANIIAISRDSMVDINMYSASGKFIGTENMQLCLAYSYGDGKATSCEYTLKAVERLFYNIPIDSYFSLKLEAISTLNNAVGGVTVPEYNDLGEPTGNNIKLWGENAINYLRYRNIQYLDSNNSRMKKQEAYIKEYVKKAVAETKKDISMPVSLFNIVSDYSVTNLSASKITYLATNALSNRDTLEYDYRKVEGNIVEGEDGLAENHVDKDALFELILDVYYNEVEE